MPEYYVRYGFQASPFRTRPLTLEKQDPLSAQAATQGVLLDIDGFQTLPACEAYLAERRSNARPAIVVIVGGKKSGLSSAAAAVLLKYRELAGLSRKGFVITELTAPDHSEVVLYTRWITALYGELRATLALSPKVEEAFKEARKLDNPATLDLDLRLVMNTLAPTLCGDDGLTLGAVFEAVRTPKAIDIAKVVFQRMNTVCVFTCLTDTFDVRPLREDPDVHVVELGHLNVPEVQRVVETRWGKTSALPFDTRTFCQFCEEKRHPVGAVLKMADDALKKRVKDMEKRGAETGRAVGFWPADENLGTPSPTETLLLLEVVTYGGA